MNIRITWRTVLLVASLGCAGLISAATSFTPDDQPVGYLAQLEVTNYVLTSGNEVVFKTDYEREHWGGNVRAFPVDARGVVNENADWWNEGAAHHIDAQDYDTGRIIVTMRSDGAPKPFRWTNLSGSQQALLGDATTGPRLLNFVRGERSNEQARGGTLRNRDTVLGDILHSRPYYLPHADGAVLFVGANDGMLHAIDARRAAGGAELWAYVPRTVIPKLPALAQSPYAHTHYVDGGLNVGTATISGSDRKVLVSGLGAGGRGLFAIDVTNPRPATEAAAAANVLWEISNADGDYQDLGYTYGTPVIAKVNTGDKTAVIVGSGYNSGKKSALYVIDITDGKRIKKIDTSGADGGGLSTPACIDTGGDGKVDYCYAGDIDGNLWKFNLTGGTGGWSASLLYTTSPAQAITAAPAVGQHPYGGYMVNFATGRLLTSADTSDTAVHYAYGILDGAPAENTELLAQTLTERSYVLEAGTKRVRVVTANAPKWTPTPSPCAPGVCTPSHRGWRVPLPVGGERVVGDTVFIENSRFYFSSTNPTITHSSPTPNGDNWLMELDFLSGSTVNSPFFDLSGDLLLNDLDRVKYQAGDPLPAGKSVGDYNTTATGVPVGKFIDNGVGSHPLLVQLATLNTTLMNQNPDVTLPAGPPSGERGVAGGHFDFDIYSSKSHHVHEYDDKYDVTGVNMLAPSDAAFNFTNMVPGKTTKFKVLVHNQYLNPAATLSIGGEPHTSVKLYNGQAKETDAAKVLANAPVYTRTQAGFTFEFNLPVDAFGAKDWWTAAGGDGYAAGDTRVGLHPTQTGCVNKVPKGVAGKMYQPVNPPANGVDGPGTAGTTTGVRHNGALVIQIIKDNTAASEIEMNVAGRPEYGWRVKDGNYNARVIGEYTAFWHHPNKLCYGDAGWTKTPPPDLDPPKPSDAIPAAGADDPKIGSFRATSAVTTVTSTTVGNVTTIVVTFADGTRQTITRTRNADGSVTIQTVNPDGSTSTTTVADPTGSVTSGGDEKGTQAKTGRISWAERFRN